MMKKMNMKQSSQKPKKTKKVRKRGNTPIYMRHELSAYMLRENPQYRHIFKKCPRCGKYSLKPVGLNKINRVIEVLDDEKMNERRCICGYVHVRNLSVSTSPKAAEELLHLGKEIYKIGGDIKKINPDKKLIEPKEIKFIKDLTEVFEEKNKQLDKMIKGDKK